MKTLRLIFLICLVNFSLVVGIFGITGWGEKGLAKGEEKTMAAVVVMVTPTERPLVVTAPTISVAPTKATIVEPVVDKSCVIIIDEVSYDVTEFKKIHSGGDMFNCGVDMSGLFHGRHPESYLEIMAKYKI